MYPTKDQAFQFALMVHSGLPAGEAILYFTSSEDPLVVGDLLKKWTRSKEFKQATLELMGKAWQDMTLEEKIDKGLNQHYSQLAYYLFSTHYAEVGATDKSKLDSARAALESKQAGNAGKTDALSKFFDDINTGRVKLNRPVPVLPH